jgi:hypothetical protein
LLSEDSAPARQWRKPPIVPRYPTFDAITAMRGTEVPANHYRGPRKGTAMKLSTVTLAAALALISVGAYAQNQNGAPSGRGSTMGDPAASSATPGTSPTTGSSMKPSPSGSGTSTSGGSDANGDQGRDKMPDSSQAVRPLDKQNKPDKM